MTEAELLQESARRAHAREGFVLCTVTSTVRSVPRDAGAKMLVAPDGSIAGSVGGGPLEAVVIAEAKQLLKDGGESCERRFALTTAGDAAEPLPPHSLAPPEERGFAPRRAELEERSIGDERGFAPRRAELEERSIGDERGFAPRRAELEERSIGDERGFAPR